MIKQCSWNIKNTNLDSNISLVDEIAASRGITYPDTSISHDPLMLNDIEEAVYEISWAVNNAQKILIYGDYDVDGICSTISLYKFLYQLTPFVSYFIPNRFTDGYGMSEKTVQNIIDNKLADLVITVDNGITANIPIDMLNDAGIKTIITDHHICPDVLPNACAIINCHRKDNTYPFADLCGTGVVYKLIEALSMEFEDLLEDFEDNVYIEYAALATVADVVPLRDENASIVLKGLNKINTNPSYAFKRLIETTAKVAGKTLTSTDLAFYIAPKINAASRMDKIEFVLSLLLSEDENEINTLCEALDGLNNQRKTITSEALCEATKQMFTSEVTSTSPIIVYSDNWDKGVIGIIAASLADTYCRPAFVFNLNPETNVLHGSCRSYKDLNIMDALNDVSDLLLSYGGHNGAAGLSLDIEDLVEFKRRLNNYYSVFDAECFKSELDIDMNISFGAITLQNIVDLDKLNPYGCENSEPIFITQNVKLKAFKALGEGKNHFKLSFEDENGINLTAMCFFSKEYESLFKVNSVYDIAYKLNINEWAGKKTIQLIIEDFHSQDFAGFENLSYESDDMYRKGEIEILDLCHETENGINDIVPIKSDFNTVHTAIGAIFKQLDVPYQYINIEVFTKLINAYTSLNLNSFKLMRILDIIADAGVIDFKVYNYGYILISPVCYSNKVKMRLSETPSFLKIQNALR